ncbi:hypothetical protein [Allosphingosinicella sp.]|jgi:hypothetical protein|uniref:hypothetical protein n=1 Tax=Allosphingosinicella sp. TaxID=2823234 RepID=UPI002F13FD10
MYDIFMTEPDPGPKHGRTLLAVALILLGPPLLMWACIELAKGPAPWLMASDFWIPLGISLVPGVLGITMLPIAKMLRWLAALLYIPAMGYGLFIAVIISIWSR